MATRRVRREDWAMYRIGSEAAVWFAHCPDCGDRFDAADRLMSLVDLLDEVDRHRRAHKEAA